LRPRRAFPCRAVGEEPRAEPSGVRASGRSHPRRERAPAGSGTRLRGVADGAAAGAGEVWLGRRAPRPDHPGRAGLGGPYGGVASRQTGFTPANASDPGATMNSFVVGKYGGEKPRLIRVSYVKARPYPVSC